MKIIGHLICQNAEAEILRCIESVYPVVDEYYVCDGGSTDNTLKVLERFKKAYNIKIFKHKFERMDKQRNFLLSKTEPGCWIVNIDQDEKLSMEATKGLRTLLEQIKIIPQEKRNNIPVAISIPLINLFKDNVNADANIYTNVAKIFYYDKDLVYKHPYHCLLYNKDSDELKITVSDAPEGFAVLHYARLDKARRDRIKLDVLNIKREYNLDEWDENKVSVGFLNNKFW